MLLQTQDASLPVAPEKGPDFLRRLQSQARYLFSEEEFARQTGREPGGPASQLALQRLSKSAHITLAQKRPARWLIIPAEQAHYGAPPVDWWLDDLMRGQEPAYYLALLSAARFWGSSHYAYQATQVMVSRARSPISVGQLRVEFIIKKRLQDTPTVQERTRTATLRVSTREATVLDLIRHQSAIGGIEAVARIAHDLLPKMTPAALLEAVQALHQVPAAQRLGFVLAQLGAQRLARTLSNWLQTQRRSVQPLETPREEDGSATLRIDADWSIGYTSRQQEMFREIGT